MSTQPENQLWLLKARLDRPLETPADREDYPWTPPWDKCYGMVVEAATEERAREIANTIRHNDDWEENGNDECIDREIRDELTGKWEGKNVWRNPKYTTCVPLVCTGKERRVIWDILRG